MDMLISIVNDPLILITIVRSGSARAFNLTGISELLDRKSVV